MKKLMIVLMMVLLCAIGIGLRLCNQAEAASTAGGLFPGMIIGYDSDTSLSFYNLCDGTSGTANLQDKMIVGAGDTYALGDTGGATTHNHSYTGFGTGIIAAGTVIKAGAGYSAAIAITLVPDVTDDQTSLPPYYAIPFWQVGAGCQGVPNGGVVWWDDVVGNIPTGWSVFSDLVDKFAIGSGNTYARTNTGGATTHIHVFGVYGTFVEGAGSPVKGVASGGNWDNTGDLSGGAFSPALSIIPLYYGLIPIENTSGGTQGIITNMVVPFNSAIGNLPAGWSELTTARNRFPVGASNTYAVDETGGASTHVHNFTCTVGGGHFAGTKILAETGGNYYCAVTGTVNVAAVAADNLPPYHALYLVKKN